MACVQQENTHLFREFSVSAGLAPGWQGCVSKNFGKYSEELGNHSRA